MNSSIAQAGGIKVLRRCLRGQSAFELAMITPLLVFLFLAGADFARIFYMSIAIDNAARAGVQYGSQTVVSAADAAGMVAAAESDGSNISGLTATASQCTCERSTLVAKCPTTYCSDDPQATFVEVDTQATFQTLVIYPGIPHTTTLSGKAIMRVQQ